MNQPGQRGRLALRIWPQSPAQRHGPESPAISSPDRSLAGVVWICLTAAVMIVGVASTGCHSHRAAVKPGRSTQSPTVTAPPQSLTKDEIALADDIALTDTRIQQLTRGVARFVDNTVLWTNERGKIGAVVFISFTPPVDLPAGLPAFRAVTEEQPLPVQPNGLYVTVPSKCTIFGTSELQVSVDFRIHAVVVIAANSAYPGGKC